MRTRFPCLRTDPSTMLVTPSVSPTLRRSSFFPLKWNDDVRPATFSPFTRASASRSSSVIPSEKYSCSLSELRFTNGSTAIDGIAPAGWARPGSTPTPCLRAEPDLPPGPTAQSTLPTPTREAPQRRSTTSGGSPCPAVPERPPGPWAAPAEPRGGRRGPARTGIAGRGPSRGTGGPPERPQAEWRPAAAGARDGESRSCSRRPRFQGRRAGPRGARGAPHRD